MAAAAPSKPRRRRKMFIPPAADGPVVQPPAQFAHLTGDDLYEALIKDRSEKWYESRVAAECGRKPTTVRAWMSTRYGYAAAVAEAQKEAEKTGARPRTVPRPKDRMMCVPDGYDTRSPWWYAGTVRDWFIQEELMDRTGVFVPYKPTGRRAGVANTKPRISPRPMASIASEVLDAFNQFLAQGLTREQAQKTLAEHYGLSLRQVARRLTKARSLHNEIVELKVAKNMPATEVAGRVRAAYELLGRDGRRRNETNLRDAVAARLGISRAQVNRALDKTAAAAGTT